MPGAEPAREAVSAALSLAPQVRAARDEMEAGRRMPLSLVDAMARAGMFRLSMPKVLGGPELDPMTQVRVVEALSGLDASTGWTAMLGLHAGYFTAFLEESVAREMYADLDAFTGGVTKPTGTAVVVPGGYRVSGRWVFGSCCQHSRWLFSGCVVVEDGSPRRLPDGSVETRLCYLPGDAIEVIDTWTSTGLRGTGSHDYAVRDVFVPAERTFDVLRAPILRTEPLYGVRNMYLSNLAGIPLGVARAAINSVIELAQDKQTRIGSNLRDEPLTHMAIARSEASLGSARAFVFDVIEDIWSTLSAGRPVTSRQHALYRLAICHAYDAGVEAVDLMYKTASGTALYSRHPLDRWFRDIHTAAQHFVVSAKLSEAAGRVLVGLPPGVPSF
jgi:indole-3-acetate monooxygenase